MLSNFEDFTSLPQWIIVGQGYSWNNFKHEFSNTKNPVVDILGEIFNNFEIFPSVPLWILTGKSYNRNNLENEFSDSKELILDILDSITYL